MVGQDQLMAFQKTHANRQSTNGGHVFRGTQTVMDVAGLHNNQDMWPGCEDTQHSEWWTSIHSSLSQVYHFLSSHGNNCILIFLACTMFLYLLLFTKCFHIAMEEMGESIESL